MTMQTTRSTLAFCSNTLLQRAVTAALLIVLFASPVRARNVDEIENPRHAHAGWVTDEPGLLGSDAGQIEERLETLHEQLGAEVAWVILRSIGDRDPRQFGTELLRHWGVGRKEHDDGVLVLHVIDRRRIEIVTGYGAEAALPDIKCSWLLQEVAVPAFHANQVARGHLALSRGIDRALRSPDISRADLIAAAQQDAPTTPTRAAKHQVTTRKAVRGGNSWMWPLLCTVAITLLFWRARVYLMLSSSHSGYDLLVPYGFLLLFLLFAMSVTDHSVSFALSMFSSGLALLVIRGFHDVRTLHKRMAPLPCVGCPGKLRWIEGDDAVALMSAGARKERELGSMRFEVRRCECGERCIEGFELESKIRRCPGCGFRTLAQVQTLTLTTATSAKEGQNEFVYRCALCSRELREIVSVPRRARSSSSSDSGSTSSDSNSSSSSRSSLGGGSSGGGGAGASY